MKVHADPKQLMSTQAESNPVLDLATGRKPTPNAPSSGAQQTPGTTSSLEITGDTVQISPEAKALNTSSPQRTFRGIPLADTVHLEMTPEMLSGEQYYSVSTHLLTGQRFYHEETESEADRILRSDMKYLQNEFDFIERVGNDVQKFVDEYEQTGDTKDLRNLAAVQGMIEGEKEVVRRHLSNNLLTYDRFDISLEHARNFMLEFSEGTLDLRNIYQEYLGIDIFELET